MLSICQCQIPVVCFLNIYLDVNWPLIVLILETKILNELFSNGTWLISVVSVRIDLEC